MKFFVTGRSSRIAEVEMAFERIVKMGHEITLNWTVFPMIKPYADNPKKAGEFAQAQISGIIEAEVYILFAHEDGTGVFTELGTALAIAQMFGKLRIFAIASDIPEAMFHYHPLITWVKIWTKCSRF